VFALVCKIINFQYTEIMTTKVNYTNLSKDELKRIKSELKKELQNLKAIWIRIVETGKD
jgi:uncharacterized protein YukE